MTLRPDAQAFDEIRIVTEPRYKTSELSGDQWRISAHVVFYRKGIERHRKVYRDVKAAAGFLYAALHEAIDDGKAYFGAREGDRCDQEGCAAPATVWYRLKHRYCSDGHKEPAEERDVRQFCDDHKKRGDCGLDDADDNYEQVPKP